MSKEQDNKAIVGRWFTEFWGETCNLGIVRRSAWTTALQRSNNSVLSARSDAHLLASPTTVGGGDASGIGFGKAECGAHQAHASVFQTTPQPRRTRGY